MQTAQSDVRLSPLVQQKKEMQTHMFVRSRMQRGPTTFGRRRRHRGSTTPRKYPTLLRCGSSTWLHLQTTVDLAGWSPRLAAGLRRHSTLAQAAGRLADGCSYTVSTTTSADPSSAALGSLLAVQTQRMPSVALARPSASPTCSTLPSPQLHTTQPPTRRRG